MSTQDKQKFLLEFVMAMASNSGTVPSKSTLEYYIELAHVALEAADDIL